MDAAPLVRLRWRLRGAWLWPSFVLLSLVDAVSVHRLPISGDSASLVSGWLTGLVGNLLMVIVLTPPVARLVRRLRPDMPRLVARDYAGALIVVAVTASLLTAGLLHRQSIDADRAAFADAAARAEAYIGDHAPAAFQENLSSLDTDVLQARRIYRSCVENRAGTRHYCVVVDRGQPFGRSVHYAGAESNGLLSQGAG